ncbi:CGNR zinc finger domain-containing protein [Nonomuraea sp. LPB2021202275-12-8]|uniref:CGNR zinc finger domain-containing protein n=1 Tax=Nonomuraea sp. LPB2021202275-12-8 TaxID=3120159 RepID=UPI00300D2B06
MGLDLVDTVWTEHGEPVDQFEDLDGVRAWLADHDLPGAEEPERARDRLVTARDAMRAVLAGQGGDRLNAVLDHGSRRPRLRGAEPYEVVVVDEAAWHGAWVAAADLVRLLAERPERVRACAGPQCVLWFLDVSRNGSRRWCSMEGCGNRAKVGRFNQRQRTGP